MNDTTDVWELTPEAAELAKQCEAGIGYRFRDQKILLQALTHASAQGHGLTSNERLEFLGDSVLGLTVSEFLYNFLEGCDEGTLTQIKSVVVSTAILANESRRLGLDRFYCVGKGVGRRNELPVSLLANVFEAVVAAIYLEGGLDAARRFVVRNLFHQILAVCDDRHEKNYKSLLQQYAQRELGLTPSYRVVRETGPDHRKSFEVAAVVGSDRYGCGFGRSKKEAEQEAARNALETLQGGVEGAAGGGGRGGGERGE
jgi:ribonuclease III